MLQFGEVLWALVGLGCLQDVMVVKLRQSSEAVIKTWNNPILINFEEASSASVSMCLWKAATILRCY